MREKHHLKQGEFADKLGITRQSMSNYESGKHSPDIDVIIKMADCLGCSTDYLLGKEEHSTYESHAEFDESLSALSDILCSIPEPIRQSWIDIFVATAQGIGKDINGDALFHQSYVVFFNALLSMLDCSLSANEQQKQGDYTKQRENRNKRFSLIHQLRTEIENLDAISYQCIEQEKEAD